MINKKLIVFILMLVWLLWIVASFVFPAGPDNPENSNILKGLKKPDMIAIDGKELYVIEGASIFVYSLNDLRLIRKFGEEGNGKGELPIPFEGANTIRLYPGYLLAESERKLIFFSRDGSVIKEKSKPWEATQFTPVGENFISEKYFHDTDTNIQYTKLMLYNKDLEEIKELYRQKWFQQYRSRDKKNFQIELFSDYLNFEVYDGKIFVEKSSEGFLIDVYNSEGNKLYSIQKEYSKDSVTEADRTAAFTCLRNDNKSKLMIKIMGSWEEVLKRMKVVYPSFKPPIWDIEIADGKLYVQTFKRMENKDEFIIMDLEGNILRSVYLPVFLRPGVEENMYGVRYQVFVGDKFYYLKENNGAWELNTAQIEK
ncbi:MAG: hypothetical protein QG657_2340 [Acidobacteriota bacterium]|nr:hypothetical protein [Acidobacteriota bacterium]